LQETAPKCLQDVTPPQIAHDNACFPWGLMGGGSTGELADELEVEAWSSSITDIDSADEDDDEPMLL